MDTKGLVPGISHRVLLGFYSPFSFIHINLEGNEWWGTKKGIKIWTEVNHKFSRGTQFLGDLVSKIKKRTAT